MIWSEVMATPAQKVERLDRLGPRPRYLQDRQALRNVPMEAADPNLHHIDAQCGQGQQNAHRCHDLRGLGRLGQPPENGHVEDEPDQRAHPHNHKDRGSPWRPARACVQLEEDVGPAIGHPRIAEVEYSCRGIRQDDTSRHERNQPGADEARNEIPDELVHRPLYLPNTEQSNQYADAVADRMNRSTTASLARPVAPPEWTQPTTKA